MESTDTAPARSPQQAVAHAAELMREQGREQVVDINPIPSWVRKLLQARKLQEGAGEPDGMVA
jgi:sugar/nucleoside kinase (ribokinase family)